MSETATEATATPEPVTHKAIVRAIGDELRIAREERGWTRVFLAKRLPSGVGTRTLLSYEHGTRTMTVTRFIEICHVLGASATELLGRAFQRARIRLEELVLQVDLMALLADDAPGLVPLHRWAHRKLRRQQSRVAELTPDAVMELADAFGCSKRELTEYLAGFIPDDRSAPESLTEDVVTAVTTRIAQTATQMQFPPAGEAIAPGPPQAENRIPLNSLGTATARPREHVGRKV